MLGRNVTKQGIFLYKMEKIKKSKKAEAKINIASILISLVLIVMLVPVIVVFSAGSNLCLEDDYPYQLEPDSVCCNTSSWINDTDSANITATNSLSTTERTLLGLVALFIILAFIFNLVKQSGLVKSSG